MAVKDLREQRAKLVADARALYDSITDKTPAAEAKEIETKFDGMMEDADGLKAKIDREERLEASEKNLGERQRITAKIRHISTDEVAENEQAETKAFNSYLRNGMGGLSAEERDLALPRFQNAQSTGSNTGGGYTVPTGFYDQLMDAEKAYGGMMDPGVAFVFDTESGNSLPIPTDNDTSNSGAILTENTQVGTQDVTFGAVTLGAYTYTSKLVLVSNQLLQDSAFNLDGFLAGKLGTRIARAINTHFTTGDGSNKPTGAVTAATLGFTGVTGETTSLIFDDLIELEHSVDPAYRKNARFMMNDASLKIIKKLKDTQGRYLWMPGMTIAGEPPTINSFGYTVNQDMPAMAANAKSILFGDFSKYFIRRVAGVQVLRLTERYADFNQTGFLAFQRWDGNLVDAGTHPLKYFANSAT
ncbi:MAG: phage major capsid protein [Pseudomonadota bacterium]